MSLSCDEREELEQLRHYKQVQTNKRLNHAFARLEELLHAVHFDPIMSPRAFRVLGDCLLALKEELMRDYV